MSNHGDSDLDLLYVEGAERGARWAKWWMNQTLRTAERGGQGCDYPEQWALVMYQGHDFGHDEHQALSF